MNKELAEDILYNAICEAYPVWSSNSYIDEYNKALDALNYLIDKENNND